MTQLCCRHETLRTRIHPWKLYQRLAGTSDVCFFLDSIRYRLPDQCYSYLALHPLQEISLRPESGAAVLTMKGLVNCRVRVTDLMKQIGEIQALLKPKTFPRRPWFRGGALGYWGYELSSLFEGIPLRRKPDTGLPWLYLAWFRDLIVYDHAAHETRLVTFAPASHRGLLAGQIGDLRERILRAKPVREKPFRLKAFKPEISRRAFEGMVRAAREHIAAGDIYQANLSQRFSFRFEGSPLRLYDELRRINPSPFAAFMKIRDMHLISSSPERLVSKRGHRCETRPIAGTRPNVKGVRALARMKRELLASSKERAEHIMLVDLERNDLGRVSDWKTVKVDEMMTIERYSHVIHIVSKITGRLAKGKTGLDLIRAMFPGGTITGCPKIRCMEIIDRLEPVRRGVYTGSVGYLGFDDDLDLNIIIRTIVLKGGCGHLQVGAGIVYDSSPAKEYEETLHKGEALAHALARASR